MQGGSSFRFVGLALTLVLLGAACDSGSSDNPPDPGNEAAAVIAFDPGGGDVFAWETDVSGRADCGEDIELVVNDESVQDVSIEESGAFSARVRLKPGKNMVRATCGSESAEMVLTGRLRGAPTANIKLKVDGNAIALDGRSSKP